MFDEKKRIFFGFEIETLWQDIPKEKKVIEEKNRHITLLFLGENNLSDVEKYLKDLPILDEKIAPVGFFDKCLFLPEKRPRLVAYRVDFLNKKSQIEKFQNQLFEFFQNKKFEIKHNHNFFLPHVTICRNNFDINKWKDSFIKTPLYLKSFNLFESLGGSVYKTLWKKIFVQKPFLEIPHTADIAYLIKGANFSDLLYNSFIALSFKCLSFLNYFKELKDVKTIDDVIINLNEVITKAEIAGEHLPFKAVCFHADIIKKDDIFIWEMIVDV
ncbi:MAG: RNA 2',3'-cyclic phosphodiesterase [Candidatus Anoxychlamydiales bacterium]|nr:RNA 2',3'-cyclic phosphodiesterase [Candidatus Anoxychlamydiales bacterium]